MPYLNENDNNLGKFHSEAMNVIHYLLASKTSELWILPLSTDFLEFFVIF